MRVLGRAVEETRDDELKVAGALCCLLACGAKDVRLCLVVSKGSAEEACQAGCWLIALVVVAPAHRCVRTCMCSLCLDQAIAVM